MNYQFTMQTSIVSESGSSRRVGNYMKTYGVTNVLVVTDQAIRRAGLIDGVTDSLAAAKLNYSVIDTVTPNPKDHAVEAAARHARERAIDGIVAVGGGSVMDFAKGVGVLLTHGGHIRDWEGDDTLINTIPPLVCIPTTVGTGSEVTWITVITDTSRNFKMGIVDPKVAPRLALLDSDLVKTLPPAVSASTGLDALTHAIEAYTSRFASPLTDALAVRAMRMIKDNIERMVHDPSDDKVSQTMLTASMMAGIAFNNSNVGSIHCLSEAMGAFYDFPHGVLNAIFLPYVFKRNIEADPVKHAEIAKILGADRDLPPDVAAQEGFRMIMDLRTRLKLPKLRELEGVSPEHFPQLAKVAKQTPMDASNIRELTEADYLHIIEEAFRE